MRYIKTSNNYVEFIEANDNQDILSVRGFNFGELYFQVKNKKVTFYLNDQENPWRNDVWTINIPFELDGELYEDEDSAAAALSALMVDQFQEQIDELREDLEDETIRSIEKDAEHDAEISGLTADLNNEITRAMSAETILHNEILAETTRALAAEDALVTALNNEVTRSTAKDAQHDAEISGLSTSLQNEINRAVGAENSLRNDLNDEVSARTSADAAQLQRITALEVGKADANNVYTKAESDAKYATKDYVSGLTDNFYTKGQTNELLAAKADKVSAVSSAMYNSQSKTIDFKNISGTVISSVDARDFIKDGMVDTVSISGNNLVITFNTDAGKEDIIVPLSNIFDPSNYYDKSDVDNIVSGLNNSIDSKLDATAYTPTDLSNYYNKQEVDASQLAQNNKIDAISGDVQTISGDVQTLSGKVDTISGDVITLGGDVQTLSGEVQTISGSAITSGEVQTMIDNSLVGYQVEMSAGTNIQISNNVISATDTKYTAGSGITITGTTNKITLDANIYKGAGMLSISCNNKQGTSGGANNVKGQTSFGAGYDIETNNNFEAAFGTSNNSVGYGNVFDGSSGKTLFSVGNGETNNKHNAFEIRQNGDIYISSGGTRTSPMIKLQDHLGGGGGGGVTPTEVQTMIDNSLSGYQETLSAGTNVQINNNVISATDTKYTAGDGISISNQNVISTVTKFWCGTQQQYDAITTKDSNTVYMIHD